MSIETATTLDLAGWQQLAQSACLPTGHFVDGELRQAEHSCGVINPANGREIGAVGLGQVADIDSAVTSAKQAFECGDWALRAPRERMAVLERLAALVEQNAQELALMESLCSGKPVSAVLAVDIPETAKSLRFFAECIDKVESAVTSTAHDVLHYIQREPLGVVGAITPWNYPLLMAAWKVAPALAAGNSVVLKPAEQTPFSSLRLAELFVEAGGPVGVFNVVNGRGAEAGQALALHMAVSKISFTGSTAVGKQIMQASGDSNLKKVALECGGKSPHIFMEDLSDLELAVEYACHGIFANMGEVCSAGSRILVAESIYGEFLEAFVSRAPQLYIAGDPLDPSTTLGPLVTFTHQRKVLGMIEQAQGEGASRLCGGEVPPGFETGAYVQPTIFSDVEPSMSIAREEVFGPVAAVIPFKDEAEAIAIANDSIYGLGAGIWTTDLNCAHRMVRDIQSGTVWVNCYDEGDMTQPFGGFKQSGNAKDKCFESLLSYSQSKSAWLKLS